MLWTTENVYHINAKTVDTIEHVVREKVWVPQDMNQELAFGYGMLPNQTYGEYIEKLNVVIKDKNYTLTKNQAQQIMLITLAGVLCGMQEYCADKKDIKIRKYLVQENFLMYIYLGDMLECLDKPDDQDTQNLEKYLYRFHWYGCSYEHVCIDVSRRRELRFYLNNAGYSSSEKCELSYKDSETLSDFYTKSDGDTNPLLFVDFGKMLCRHTHPQYDSRNSIWDGKYAGQRVLQMCDLVGAVRNMGDKYVLAPAFNLYANAVLQSISDYRKHLSK